MKKLFILLLGLFVPFACLIGYTFFYPLQVEKDGPIAAMRFGDSCENWTVVAVVTDDVYRLESDGQEQVVQMQKRHYFVVPQGGLPSNVYARYLQGHKIVEIQTHGTVRAEGTITEGGLTWESVNCGLEAAFIPSTPGGIPEKDPFRILKFTSHDCGEFWVVRHLGAKEHSPSMVQDCSPAQELEFYYGKIID